MDDAELRTLILETIRDLPRGGFGSEELTEAVLAKLPPGKMEAVLFAVFEGYVTETVDAALDFQKARLN
jgi:hypothetical protein